MSGDVTISEFSVLLSDFSTAMRDADRAAGDGEHALDTIKGSFKDAEDDFKSPAGTSFVALVNDFNTASSDLTALLDETTKRLHASHDQYATMEHNATRRVRNLEVVPDPAPAAGHPAAHTAGHPAAHTGGHGTAQRRAFEIVQPATAQALLPEVVKPLPPSDGA